MWAMSLRSSFAYYVKWKSCQTTRRSSSTTMPTSTHTHHGAGARRADPTARASARASTNTQRSWLRRNGLFYEDGDVGAPGQSVDVAHDPHLVPCAGVAEGLAGIHVRRLGIDAGGAQREAASGS